jgi:hypothetical protein
MSFSWRGISVLLKGLQLTALSLEENSNFLKSSNKGVVLQLIERTSIKAVVPILEVLRELLGNFEDVFEKPKGLPPTRSHDHKILLKNDATPVCVRPYRYPYFQKTKIEKIFRELLQSRVVRPSQSFFSSPVLLVKKADGS